MEITMIQLQLLCALFALSMIYWSYLSFRRHTIRLPEFLTVLIVKPGGTGIPRPLI